MLSHLVWRWLFVVAASLVSLCAVAGKGGNLTQIEFEGNQKIFAPGAQGTVRFMASDYAFGGREFAYFVVAITPVDAPITNPTLRDMSNWDVYGILLRTPRILPFAEVSRPYEVTFTAPSAPGKYRIVWGEIPQFYSSPLTSDLRIKTAFRAEGVQRALLVKSLLDNRSSFVTIDSIVVTNNMVKMPDVIPLYLQVNGKVPASAKFAGGLQDKPIELSWYVGDEFKREKAKVLYRYRMEPEDDDWGAWTAANSVSYSFLHRGVHRFIVQAKYTEVGQVMESIPATFQFALGKEHVSKPTPETLTKGVIGTGAAAVAPIAFKELYAKSRALLIGTWKFDDAARFPQFDQQKISTDVSTLKAALVRNGFEVTTLVQERIRREDITAAMSKLVRDAGRGDRLLVYFSTHGFADPLLPSKGFLATADCTADDPRGRCFALDELSEHAERAIEGKLVRQVLFAVDSCFSGLGVAQKSVAVTTNLNQLAMPQGVFMLTAGMANQLAQIDPQLGMSTFTHYLANGLNGDADILGNNGIITLSELFVYVQYKVAERTQSKQIPMLGRIRGDGEMLFMPTR